VRVESTVLGLQADLLAHALDLCREGGELLPRLNASPDRTAIALLETADVFHPDGERLGTDFAQGIREIVGKGTVHLSDEAEGYVQLLLRLPAEVGTIVHRVDHEVADRLRRTNGYEQAMHIA